MLATPYNTLQHTATHCNIHVTLVTHVKKNTSASNLPLRRSNVTHMYSSLNICVFVNEYICIHVHPCVPWLIDPWKYLCLSCHTYLYDTSRHVTHIHSSCWAIWHICIRQWKHTFLLYQTYSYDTPSHGTHIDSSCWVIWHTCNLKTHTSMKTHIWGADVG